MPDRMIGANLRSVLREPRMRWLLLSSVAAAVTGFAAVPDRHAIAFVSKAGYWMVLAGVACWIWSLRVGGVIGFGRRPWGRLDPVGAALIAGAGLILLVHERFGFKIVMDELMLLGTSMSMHLDRLVLTPLRGNDIQGAFEILEGMVDKRPLLFPFLLSVVHDVAGYRPENAFALNVVLTFVLLGLVWKLGGRLAGRTGGALGVVLLAGLPLLGQNATGGGFELLNLVMIVVTLLLGVRFAERRDGPALGALVFSAVLLAQVRYESVVFLGPVALLVILVWVRDGRAEIPWPVVAAPLLLVHVPLHQRIFDLRASAWELTSRPGFTEPFSVSYVPDNLAHALAFFFGRASDQPNSLVLSALGGLAVPFVALRVARWRLEPAGVPAVSAVTALFGLGFLLHFALLMCYFWGKFDDPVIRRLSLPAHLGLVLAVLLLLPAIPTVVARRVVLAVAVLGVLIRGVPSMAAHAYSQEYTPGRETAWRREFMAAMPRPDYLMIDNDATLWVTHRVSATPTSVASKRVADIAFHLRNRTFSDILVFQRFNVDPDSGALTLRAGDDPGPAFLLEPVAERRLHPLTLSRISRVREIRTGDGIVSAPETVRAATPLSAAELERARLQFLETYLKKLP
ncbi:MAG: hypothetical protein RLZZ188_1086 [Verrucomicrobiota bacterium]